MQKIQHLLSDHLNIWTTAEAEKKSGRGRTNISGIKIYGIQKLRELILDLAISGKLIAKKTIDNLAINVSKDIEIEINKLTEKGLLAKRKLLAPVKENEKLFNLPNGWEWIRLGNTGKIFNGNSINENEKETKYTNINDGRPFIATKDVGYGREELNYKNGILIPFNESKFKVAHKNAVLICSEGGSAGKKIGITNFDICFGNKLIANETFSAINPRLIFYIYQSQSFYQSFFKRMTGIIGGISINEFLNIPVPIPPLLQQNEIVNKIDELMALCDQLEQQHINSEEAHQKLVKVLLDTLTQSKDADEFENSWQRITNHFNTLFTTEESIDDLKQTLLHLAVTGKLVPQDSNDEPASELIKRIENEKATSLKPKTDISLNESAIPFNIPKEWEWVYFGNIAQHNSGKTLDSSRNSGTYQNYITTSNLYWGKFDLTSLRKMPIEDSELEKCTAKKGDLLIVEGGEAGRAAVWEGDNDICFQNHIHRARFYGKINPYYAYRYFENMNATGEINEYRKGVAISSMSGKLLASIPFPLPPLNEQDRIVEKLEVLIALCNELKSRIHQASVKQKQIADVLVSQALH